MRPRYYLPQVVCLKAKNTGEIIQGADLFIGKVPKNGIWTKLLTEDSPWANPFPCFKQQKESCLVTYEAWLRNEIAQNPQVWFPRMYYIVSQGRPITLGRFCGPDENNPFPNHGEVIIRVLAEFIQLLDAGQVPEELLTTNSAAPQNFPSTQNPITQQKINQQNNLNPQKQIQNKNNQQNNLNMQNPINLPYVVVGVNGLQPSNQSKVVIIQVRDPDVGNFDVSLFISAGQVPTKVVQTHFGPEAGDQFAQQKATIQQQNQNAIIQNNDFPIKFSNGVDPEGVCAQYLKGFDLKGSFKVDFPNCQPPNNQPVSQPALQNTIQQLPQQPLPGLTIGNLPRPNQPILQQPQPMISIGNIASGTTSGGSGTVQQINAQSLPAGSVPYQIVDLTTGNLLPNPSYKLPGGPRPIAFGEKWYWYLLQNGDIIKSTQNLIPAGYIRPGRDTPTGINQVPRAQRAKQISLQRYPLDQFPINEQLGGGKASSGKRAAVTIIPSQPPPPTGNIPLPGLSIIQGLANNIPGGNVPQQPFPNQFVPQSNYAQQPLPQIPLPAISAVQPKSKKKAAAQTDSENESEYNSEEEVGSEPEEEFSDDEIIGVAPIQGASRLTALPAQPPILPNNLLPLNTGLGQLPTVGRPLVPQQPVTSQQQQAALAGLLTGLPTINLSKPYNGAPK